MAAKTRSEWCMRPCETRAMTAIGVGGFFEDGGDHQGAIAGRICGDETEGDLPSQGAAYEAVIEAWVRDGWRIFLTDEVKHKIERRDDQQAPDAGNPKDNFCEFHGLFQSKRVANQKNFNKWRIARMKSVLLAKS